MESRARTNGSTATGTGQRIRMINTTPQLTSSDSSTLAPIRRMDSGTIPNSRRVTCGIWMMADVLRHCGRKVGMRILIFGRTFQTASEHWAVRRWISDVSGVVTVRGQIGKTMPWGSNWRGQCEAMIIVDGKLCFSSIMDEQSLDYALAVKLQKDSTVDFLIAPASGFGVVDFHGESGTS